MFDGKWCLRILKLYDMNAWSRSVGLHWPCHFAIRLSILLILHVATFWMNILLNLVTSTLTSNWGLLFGLFHIMLLYRFPLFTLTVSVICHGYHPSSTLYPNNCLLSVHKNKVSMFLWHGSGEAHLFTTPSILVERFKKWSITRGSLLKIWS